MFTKKVNFNYGSEGEKERETVNVLRLYIQEEFENKYLHVHTSTLKYSVLTQLLSASAEYGMNFISDE